MEPSKIIRLARAKKAMTQQEFAELVGIKRQDSVSKYETGKSEPPSAVLLRCLQILNPGMDLGDCGNPCSEESDAA